MSSATNLGLVFIELNKAMENTLSNTEISEIKETIQHFAIAAAAAGALSGMVPGVASVVAVVTQTGLVWATYVKINKTLGISMKENTAKFIGSAILTNLMANAGTYILAIVATAILSFIPIFGQLADAAIFGVLGYVVIYVAALLYLKLITRWVKPDRTLNIDESDETKAVIADMVKGADLKDMIKEGRSSYKQAKADGLIDEAIKNPTCPNCGVKVEKDQAFCSSCGFKLK